MDDKNKRRGVVIIVALLSMILGRSVTYIRNNRTEYGSPYSRSTSTPLRIPIRPSGTMADAIAQRDFGWLSSYTDFKPT